MYHHEKDRMAGWSIVSVLVLLTVMIAAGAGLNALTGKGADPESPPSMSPLYDVYIGFTAERDCVPEKGPYLTMLTYDFHIPGIRFSFSKRSLDGLMVNWFPHRSEGKDPAIPVLTFMADGQVDASLCPHNLCPIREGSSKRELKRAWFTKQEKSCFAVVSVVALPDIPEVLDETLWIDTTGTGFSLVPIDMRKQTPIMHVKVSAHDNFAYTTECTVRQQDAGGTDDWEFYLALPSWELRNGRPVTAELPFRNDDIKAMGKLTVRFLPVGSVK